MMPDLPNPLPRGLATILDFWFTVPYYAASLFLRYFGDMLEAVCYLHSQSIVHRDIRCDHFLLDQHDRVKLCDFSSASRFSPGSQSLDGQLYTSTYVYHSQPYLFTATHDVMRSQ